MSRQRAGFFIKEYLSFSKIERNGIIVLLALIFLILVFRYLVSNILPQKPIVDIGKFDGEIVRFEQSCDSLKPAPKVRSSKNSAQSLPKFLSKNAEPVSKIDINTADSSALDNLRGIGPIFAHRIIKYRNILGGFYSLKQLNEVYGLKPETVFTIEKFLLLDTSKIQKINLNTAEFKKINVHPYISFEQTKAIFKLRSKHKIEGTLQLIEEGIFTVEEIEKIQHYILFN